MRALDLLGGGCLGEVRNLRVWRNRSVVANQADAVLARFDLAVHDAVHPWDAIPVVQVVVDADVACADVVCADVACADVACADVAHRSSPRKRGENGSRSGKGEGSSAVSPADADVASADVAHVGDHSSRRKKETERLLECGMALALDRRVRAGDWVEFKRMSQFTACWVKVAADDAHGRLREETQEKERKAKWTHPVDLWRRRGNASFRRGLYELAREDYEAAIACHADGNALLQGAVACHGNCALCWLKLGNPEAAEKMCNQGLEALAEEEAGGKDVEVEEERRLAGSAPPLSSCGSDWVGLKVKLLLRRAAARKQMEFFGEALADLEAVLRLQPANADAAAMAGDIRKIDANKQTNT